MLEIDTLFILKFVWKGLLGSYLRACAPTCTPCPGTGLGALARDTGQQQVNVARPRKTKNSFWLQIGSLNSCCQSIYFQYIKITLKCLSVCLYIHTDRQTRKDRHNVRDYCICIYMRAHTQPVPRVQYINECNILLWLLKYVWSLTKRGQSLCGNNAKSVRVK